VAGCERRRYTIRFRGSDGVNPVRYSYLIWPVVAGIAALVVWRNAQGQGFFTLPSFSSDNETPPEPAAPIDVKTPAQSTYDLIARFEGFSASAYRDAKGWSIGYGHYMGPVATQATITQDEALQWLQNDVSLAAYQVAQNVSVPLTQNEFDALVSLAYNIGGGAFSSSTLVRLLNSGDRQGAAAQFPRWNQSQGVVLGALVDRRAQEQHVFLT
jgi:lysozyme